MNPFFSSLQFSRNRQPVVRTPAKYSKIRFTLQPTPLLTIHYLRFEQCDGNKQLSDFDLSV